VKKNHIKEKINNQIQAKEIRLIGDNIIPGIYNILEAKKIATDLNLDLVEINSSSTPPIVKIIDYNKYKYLKKIKEKELKKKQKKSKQLVKEIRFRPNTDEHDYNFKAKHARKFLENGDIVKAYVFFKGREIVFKEQGQLLLMKLADELSDIGLPISLNLKIENKKMIMNIKPKKNK